MPLGVCIGLSPRASQIVQPIAQFLAAFPANLLFPLFVILIVRYDLNVDVRTSPLMILGTQWYILFNVVAGLIRISIFILYLFLISRLKDVQTLFQYHGAEHKTIYTFENGTELSYENAKKFKKEHPRCGTSFLFIVMLVSIFSYSIIDSIFIILYVE